MGAEWVQRGCREGAEWVPSGCRERTEWGAERCRVGADLAADARHPRPHALVQGHDALVGNELLVRVRLANPKPATHFFNS